MNTLKFGNGEWYGKKDTILAYNDLNSNYKPLPFNFSRASSATVINKDGLIETVGSGEPRIDYKDDSKGALKLEPQKTNNLPYSQDFSTWSATGGASVVGNKLGIGGSNDAFEFLSDGSANTRLYYSLSNTGELSFSVFAKKNTLDYIALYGNGGSNPRVWFNLANGTLGNQEGAGTGSIESYGNGWYRCTMNWTSASLVNVRIYNSNENDVFGGTVGSVYIQYAQVEQGSYSTSPINTQGGAVTRLADVCTNGANEQVINSTEGVFYAEISAFTDALNFELISLSDGGSSNRCSIFFNSGSLSTVYKISNVNSFVHNENVNLLDFHKVAISYKQSQFKMFIDGVKVQEQLSGNVLPSNTFNTLSFDRGDGANNFYGNTKDVRVYNTALTDNELIALTTI